MKNKIILILGLLLANAALGGTDIVPNPSAPGNLGAAANRFPTGYFTNIYGVAIIFSDGSTQTVAGVSSATAATIAAAAVAADQRVIHAQTNTLAGSGGISVSTAAGVSTIDGSGISGGASLPSTANLFRGNGSGGAVDSGISAASVITTASPFYAGTTNVLWNPEAKPIFATPLKGINGWLAASAFLTNDTAYYNTLSNMVARGMVKNDFVWVLFDSGASLPAAAGGGQGEAPFPLLTNYTPYAGLMNSDGWVDFDKTAYPSGASNMIWAAHTNGIKFMLYCANATNGAISAAMGTNHVQYSQPGCFGPEYYFAWLSNAIVNWKLDGIKDDNAVVGPYTNVIRQQQVIGYATAQSGRPFFLNVSASGYQPWFHGMLNSWRVGTGIYGDVTSNAKYYQWLDMTPFWVTAPGSFNDLDEMQCSANCTYWTSGLLFRNELAMNSMANTSLQGNIPPKGYALLWGYYYDYFSIPVVRQIDDDYKFHVEKVYTNNLLVVYRKELSDGTFAFCVQNRSNTLNQSFTLTLTNFYPNQTVCTIHDCYRDAPISVQTNTYTLTVSSNDSAWFIVKPGIEQPFHAGSNYLANFPWSDCQQIGNGAAISVNGYGNGQVPTFPQALNNNPANGTNQTGFYIPVTYSNMMTWNLNGNGTTLTFAYGSLIATNALEIYGDGVLLFTTNSVVNSIKHLSVDIRGVNTLSIRNTNGATNPGSPTSYAFLGDPVIWCDNQTVQDAKGGVKVYTAAISSAASMNVQTLSTTSLQLNLTNATALATDADGKIIAGTPGSGASAFVFSGGVTGYSISSATDRYFFSRGTLSAAASATSQLVDSPCNGQTITNVGLYACNGGAALLLTTNLTATAVTNDVDSNFVIILAGNGSMTQTNSGTQSLTLPQNGTWCWKLRTTAALSLSSDWSTK